MPRSMSLIYPQSHNALYRTINLHVHVDSKSKVLWSIAVAVAFNNDFRLCEDLDTTVRAVAESKDAARYIPR